MKSLATVGTTPAGKPLLADSILETHAARLLLLLRLVGRRNKIQGLTKLAKLDFFVRYPAFFLRAAPATAGSNQSPGEGGMVRHHYGPWDPRYYDVLSYLESRGLLSVTKRSRAFGFELSETGVAAADSLVAEPAFAQQVEQIRAVGRAFGGKSGSWLKNHVYEEFATEIANLPMGRDIA